MIKKLAAIVAITLFVSACATQRYGRLTPLSPTETSALDCRDIQIEIAKAEEFIDYVRSERADTNGAHVLGFLGDFGIGNVMEGDDAEASGHKRLRELKNLSAQRGCEGQGLYQTRPRR